MHRKGSVRWHQLLPVPFLPSLCFHPPALPSWKKRGVGGEERKKIPLSHSFCTTSPKSWFMNRSHFVQLNCTVPKHQRTRRRGYTARSWSGAAPLPSPPPRTRSGSAAVYVDPAFNGWRPPVRSHRLSLGFEGFISLRLKQCRIKGYVGIVEQSKKKKKKVDHLLHPFLPVLAGLFAPKASCGADRDTDGAASRSDALRVGPR